MLSQRSIVANLKVLEARFYALPLTVVFSLWGWPKKSGASVIFHIASGERCESCDSPDPLKLHLCIVVWWTFGISLQSGCQQVWRKSTYKSGARKSVSLLAAGCLDVEITNAALSRNIEYFVNGRQGSLSPAAVGYANVFLDLYLYQQLQPQKPKSPTNP